MLVIWFPSLRLLSLFFLVACNNLNFFYIIILFFLFTSFTVGVILNSRARHVLFMLSLLVSACLIRRGPFKFLLFFEFILIPGFWLIFKLSESSVRPKAAILLFIYGSIFRVPLILLVYLTCGFVSFERLYHFNHSFFLILLSIGFLSKLPVFGLHRWLPVAHGEASTEGRIYLAGVLLKVGVFGLIYFISSTYLQLNLLIALGLIRRVIRTFLVFIMIQKKKYIAISSVAHISILVILLLWPSNSKFFLVLLGIIAHGIRRPLMFIMAGYQIRVSNNKNLLAGQVRICRAIGLLCWIRCLMWMGLPPSINFIMEWQAIILITSVRNLPVFLFTCIMFIGSIYPYVYGKIFNRSEGIAGIPTSSAPKYLRFVLLGSISTAPIFLL